MKSDLVVEDLGIDDTLDLLIDLWQVVAWISYEPLLSGLSDISRRIGHLLSCPDTECLILFDEDCLDRAYDLFLDPGIVGGRSDE